MTSGGSSNKKHMKIYSVIVYAFYADGLASGSSLGRILLTTNLCFLAWSFLPSPLSWLIVIEVLMKDSKTKNHHQLSFCYSRYLAGMKEFEVELEFSSAMTAYPDRRRTGGETYRDGEAPQLGSQSDLSSDM